MHRGLGVCRQRGQQVAFIVGQQAQGHRREHLRHRRQPGGGVARIQHHQGEIGGFQFGTSAAHAFAFDRIAALAQAGGVHQRQFQTIQAHGFTQNIPGGAGNVGDDGAIAAGQRVQQGALAGVGRTHDHRMQAIAKFAPAFGVGQ